MALIQNRNRYFVSQFDIGIFCFTFISISVYLILQFDCSNAFIFGIYMGAASHSGSTVPFNYAMNATVRLATLTVTSHHVISLAFQMKNPESKYAQEKEWVRAPPPPPSSLAKSLDNFFFVRFNWPDFAAVANKSNPITVRDLSYQERLRRKHSLFLVLNRYGCGSRSVEFFLLLLHHRIYFFCRIEKRSILFSAIRIASLHLRGVNRSHCSLQIGSFVLRTIKSDAKIQ